MSSTAALAGLFAAAFLAATPVPFQSEVVFLGLQASGSAPLIWLVAIASVGNTLGSCLTYALGRGLGGFRTRRWFPLTPAQITRAEGWFQRWGVWTLLISWAPGGDLLVAMAGVLRVRFAVFLTLVAVAKTARYAVLALIADGVLSLATVPVPATGFVGAG